jgi:hypothetical protein
MHESSPATTPPRGSGTPLLLAGNFGLVNIYFKLVINIFWEREREREK